MTARLVTARLARAALALVVLATGAVAAAPVATAAPSAPAAPTHRVTVPVLTGRATLSADHLEPGPDSGAKVDGLRRGPFPGQPVPGFSALVPAGGDTYWALPDNGYGAKNNSADFELRIYRVKADMASGRISILQTVSIADPNHKLAFDIVHGDTKERLLTGSDLDVESLVVDRDGSFWIGDEFGPWIVHVGADGALLDAPYQFPLAKSPSNPDLGREKPKLSDSKGFEAMYVQGGKLHVITEGAIEGTPARSRTIMAFDPATKTWGETMRYDVDTDANLAADAVAVGGRVFVLERDSFDGPQAVTKRVYEFHPGQRDASGAVQKTLVADLLDISNPRGIGKGTGWGTGDPFRFGLNSVESLAVGEDGSLVLANDNNYPFDDARRAGQPDDTEIIRVQLETTERAANAHTVIAHRGASGYRPEHTMAAYEVATQQCADYIEPDLVMTKDGVLVDRHEPEISSTTDVADHKEFADRKRTEIIDGIPMTGWFTTDFTLAELRTLRAKERLPKIRPHNVAFDGLYPIPTFEEVLDLARHSRTCDGRPMGIYPEIKHSTWHHGKGLDPEAALVKALRAAHLDGKSDPVVIQSFEVGNLQRLNGMVGTRLAQLVDSTAPPADRPTTLPAQMVSKEGLTAIATYADGVGLYKELMIPRDKDGRLGRPTPVIADAKAAGLEVVGWTFRRENEFLPTEFQKAGPPPTGGLQNVAAVNPATPGDLVGEIRAYLCAGMDTVFTDNPDLGVEAVNGVRCPTSTAEPTVEPSAEPTVEPSAAPTEEPTEEPSAEPSAEPTAEPSAEPSADPAAQPLADTGGPTGLLVVAGLLALGLGATLLRRH